VTHPPPVLATHFDPGKYVSQASLVIIVDGALPQVLG
jgi:hypothetical protein